MRIRLACTLQCNVTCENAILSRLVAERPGETAEVCQHFGRIGASMTAVDCSCTVVYCRAWLLQACDCDLYHSSKYRS